MFEFYLSSNIFWFCWDMMTKTKWKSGVFFVWHNVRWDIMYGVFNVGLFTFINVVGCFLFQFQVMKFFFMSQFDKLVKHSDDVHWNVRTNIQWLKKSLVIFLGFLKMIKPLVITFYYVSFSFRFVILMDFPSILNLLLKAVERLLLSLLTTMIIVLSP